MKLRGYGLLIRESTKKRTAGAEFRTCQSNASMRTKVGRKEFIDELLLKDFQKTPTGG